jgi:hypothetical protein
VTTFIPRPAGLSLDASSWGRTPLVVRQLVVQLLTVIQQQAVRIAALDARLSQNFSNSYPIVRPDRLPRMSNGQPALACRVAPAPSQGTLGIAKRGCPPRKSSRSSPGLAPVVSGSFPSTMPRVTAGWSASSRCRRRVACGTSPRFLSWPKQSPVTSTASIQMSAGSTDPCINN